MSVETKWPPEPSETIAELAGLLRVLHDALAYGADEAVKHYERRKRAINPWLYAHLAREEAWNYLANADIKKQFGFELKKIAMSGIWLKRDDVEIRTLKMAYRVNRATGETTRGVPPSDSQARREYFYQPPLALSWVPGELPLMRQPLKLVALWDHDEAHQLGTYELACPKRYDASRNCVDTHWLQPIDIAEEDLGMGTLPTERALLEDFDLHEHRDDEQVAQ